MNSLPSANNCVQANSVQSQFAALTRDRDKFQNEKDDAERESKRAQERLRRLKEEQVLLMSKIQASQERLGALSRKQTMLQQEGNRLHKVMQSERKALEACASHATNLEQQVKQMTKKFNYDVGKTNEEAARILGQQLVNKIVKYISVESIEAVVANSAMSPSCKKKLEQMKHLQQKLVLERARYEDAKDQSRQIVAPSKNGAASNGVVIQAVSQMDIFYSMNDSNRRAM